MGHGTDRRQLHVELQMERTATKGCHIPPAPPSAAAASSDSEPVIPFVFGGGKEAVATAVGYTELVSVVLAMSYHLVLLGSPSFPLFTGTGTDEDATDLGAARQFLGSYGGGGGGKGEGGKGVKLQKKRIIRKGRGEVTPPTICPTPIRGRATMKMTNPKIWKRGQRSGTGIPR